MKTEDLQSKGLSQEQIAFVMAENGKDLKKLQKDNETLAADRDKWKTQAKTAEETLKSFEGIDPAKIQAELDAWKQKAADAEKNAREQIYERDFNDALKTELESIKFTSEAAKRDVMSQIKTAELKLKDGKILGLSDLLGQIKRTDASAFADEQQEQLEDNRARFTTVQKSGNGARFKAMSKKDILNIKDPTERQAAIAENLGLFGKGD